MLNVLFDLINKRNVEPVQNNALTEEKWIHVNEQLRCLKEVSTECFD